MNIKKGGSCFKGNIADIKGSIRSSGGRRNRKERTGGRIPGRRKDGNK